MKRQLARCSANSETLAAFGERRAQASDNRDSRRRKADARRLRIPLDDLEVLPILAGQKRCWTKLNRSAVICEAALWRLTDSRKCRKSVRSYLCHSRKKRCSERMGKMFAAKLHGRKGASHDNSLTMHAGGYAGEKSLTADPSHLRAAGLPVCTPL